MNEAQVKAMHKEISEFMEQLSKKYNFSAAGSRISYTGSEFTLNFKGNMIDPATGKKVVDKALINRAARALFKIGSNLDVAKLFEKDYDFEGVGRGRVIDVRSKAPKYPFVVEAANGSKYALSATSVARSVKLGNHF